MADSLLQAELLAACSAIGYSDGDKYYLEADYLETIKDLIRYLRKDDDSHRIRRALGETRVIQTDLIPIIKYHNDNCELFDVALRLLVNLTNPVLLLYKEELPEEKITYQQYLQILNHQQGFKQSFADDNIWKVVIGILGKILEKEWADREEEERLTLERILIVIRNILAIPSNPEDEKRTDDDASVHDQVLWALHLSRLEDLLLYIASSESEQDLCLHVLEIISLMLKEQDPTHLAQAGLQRSQSEKLKDQQELLQIREREMQEKHKQIKKHYNARHSRFGGTYYVANMKSISDRQLIMHSHVSDFKSINFDTNKKLKKTPKNRRPLRDCSIVRRSTLAIRLFLQEFCVEFLRGAYNSLMYSVKDDLNRGKTQEHDESYYLWAIRFFLAFNRNHKFKLELITETLNVQQFHYIQTLFENYFEQMSTDKKKIPLWSRRMHKALEAYQELLLTLHYMDKSIEESVRESSNVLKNKIFYVVEYRELPLLALQNFDEIKMTKSYLKDLAETVHVFLKLLESICSKHLFVQGKAKKKKNIKKATGKSELTENEKSIKWENSVAPLMELIQGNKSLPLTIPFDALADQSDEEQKEIAMKRIHHMLHNLDYPNAISLLRSCREVWPENNLFGAEGLNNEEELFCLKLIFEADLGHIEIAPEVSDSSSSEEEESRQIFSDQEFNILEFVRRFAHSKIMQSYGILFKSFLNNSEYTNHCILKLYHRIAWDCKLPAIFFQASLFRVFEKILESSSNYSKAINDGAQFAKFILKKFFETAATNDKVFIEMLFWKTNKEALEIEVGYGNAESKTNKPVWTEDDEYEIRRLFEEFKNNTEISPDKDIADLITENLINKERNRRMVIKKLKEMELIENIKELKRKTVRVKGKDWTDEEIDELKYLYEEHKNAVHPLARIMDFKIVKRPKRRIVEKLLELGLINDKKELRRKTIRKEGAGRGKTSGEQFLAANASSSESNTDSDESDTVEPRSKSKSAPTPASIQASLKSVTENGLSSAVEWIAELLEDTANDREEDNDCQPIPILALGEDHNNALENVHFKELLYLIGLQAPLHQQEMFWRIPSSLGIHGLRKRVEFLRKGTLECDFSGQNLISAQVNESSDTDDESVDDLSDRNVSSDTETNIDVSRFTNLSRTSNSILNPMLISNDNKYSFNSLHTQENKSSHGDSDDNALIISGRNVLISRSNNDVNNPSESDEESSRRRLVKTLTATTITSSDSEDNNTFRNMHKGTKGKIVDSDDDSQNLDLNVGTEYIPTDDRLDSGRGSVKKRTISSDEDSPLKMRKAPRLRVISDSD